MNPKWTPEQDAILRAMYWDAPMDQIIAATGKPLHGIYRRAKRLLLKRHHIGGFRVGHTIRNLNRKRAATKPPSLQDRILTLLMDTDSAWVARDIAKSFGTETSVVSFALRCLHRDCVIHIAEYRPKRLKHDPPFVPAYAFGDADDAPMQQGPEEIERFHAPNPIPRPELCPIDMWAFSRTTQEITE